MSCSATSRATAAGRRSMNPVGRHCGSQRRGFSLLEMMMVLVIISLLLLAALPSGTTKVDQAGISEALTLVERYKLQIEQFYMLNNEFPPDNTSAGMPEPKQIRGNYLAAAHQVDGALHLELGNKISEDLQGKIVSIRPVIVPGVDNAPISWICGVDTVPTDMVAAGENRTDVEGYRLPVNCR